MEPRPPSVRMVVRRAAETAPRGRIFRHERDRRDIPRHADRSPQRHRHAPRRRHARGHRRRRRRRRSPRRRPDDAPARAARRRAARQARRAVLSDRHDGEPGRRAVHSAPGTEILVDDDAHLVNLTSAGIAALRGRAAAVHSRRPDALRRGRPSARALAPRPAIRRAPRSCRVENTHNGAGGADHVARTSCARSRTSRASSNVPVHLDGARLWNVEAATGVAVGEFAACADTVMVSFSKGLGAPVGAALAGSVDAHGCRVDRSQATGRRAAAVGHHRCRGAVRHRAQSRSARRGSRERDAVRCRASATRAARRVVPPDTNIVMIDLPSHGRGAERGARARARAGCSSACGAPTRLRAVTHLDVSERDSRRGWRDRPRGARRAVESTRVAG